MPQSSRMMVTSRACRSQRCTSTVLALAGRAANVGAPRLKNKMRASFFNNAPSGNEKAPAKLPALSRRSNLGKLAGSRRRNRRSSAVSVIDEILQFLAGLEKRYFLRRYLYLFARLWVAPHAAAPLPCAEAAKSPNLDFLALLQGPDDALENGFHDCFRFPARQF